MFSDPALVLRCQLPIGWCVDSESSLFRIVFRPWNRSDERVVVTVIPAPVAPTVSDDDWAAASSRFVPGVEVEPLVLAAGPAVTAPIVSREGHSHRRVVIRGSALDLILDHVRAMADSGGISPVLHRIAASARTPARLPSREPDADSLEDARASTAVLTRDSEAEAIRDEFQRLEAAAEERWLRCFLRRDFDGGLDALDALLTAKLTLGQSPARLLTLNEAFGVLLRAVPYSSPTEPYIPVDERLRPRLAEQFKHMFAGVSVALRRRSELKDRHIPDEAWGSILAPALQMLIGTLIIENVREVFKQGERPSTAAAYEGLLAHFCALATFTGANLDANPPGRPGDSYLHLGRSLTAYIEAAGRTHDLDSVVEASEYLTSIGGRLFDLATSVDRATGALYRAEGATYAATGLSNQAAALVETADQISLEQALTVVEHAHRWLTKAPLSYGDIANVNHQEALAALQLGDVARARRAARRGRSAANRIGNQNQVRIFDWVEKTARLVGDGPPTIRSFPELEYLRATAEEGADAALRGLCAALERDLAEDPTGPTTIERLVLAARLLDSRGSGEIFAVVGSLLDLNRLLVIRERQLQLGSDDSLLARGVMTDLIGKQIRRGHFKEALRVADSARARSLLLDLTLPPGQTAYLRQIIDQGYNPGVPRLVEALARDRVPKPFRPLAQWDGPFGPLRARSWLQGLGKDLRKWVNTLTKPLGVSPLTADEIVATAQEHRQPILVVHPIGERVALFLVVPDGTIRHIWSASGTTAVMEQGEKLRAELGVWVRTRQRGDGDWDEAGTADFGYRQAAAALYQCLVAPLRQHLRGYKHLTIVPYRELGSLPFALLEDKHGTPLLERFSISITPSIASLRVFKQRVRHASRNLAYVIGDPLTPRNLHLEALEGAAVEAEVIRDRIRATYPDASVVFRTGADATPANYAKEAAGARVVHLACHAGVGATAAASALYLAQGPDGDSTLDFEEVARVPLDKALVFLAACRSGAGRATADGTIGLAREFLRAGASAVIASYWKVSDDATSMLATQFYSRFLRRGGQPSADGPVDVATALRDAMLATRANLSRAGGGRQRAHAGAWAPFFVLGDGSLTDPLR